ncbi:unnamed protein product [Diamesa serratosioi]
MMEKFLVANQTYPEWFEHLTYEDVKLKELYDSGYIVPLPQRDENGCRVILIQAAKLDANKYTCCDILRIINLVLGILLEEHETQIAGFVYIIDHKDITMKYISLFSLIDVKNYLNCIQNAVPGRQKKLFMVHLPSFAVILVDFAKSLISKKLKSRVFVANNAEELHKNVQQNILPKEYGGVIPVSEMMENFRSTMHQHQDKLLIESIIEFKPKHQTTSANSGVAGSFRKLEID